MSQRFLLDTSALIAHFRREPGWDHVQALFEGDAEILGASVTLVELARRLRELGATVEEARRTVQDYRDLLDDLVAVDEKVALAAFDIGCAAASRLPLVDALIAASAHERNACLVHRDRHMASIPESLLAQLQLPAEPGFHGAP
jgi:predicted nucleic acid-binding protein